METVFSKINKDHFFAVEEFMKNDIFFSNGRIRYHLDMLYRGTHTGVHFIKKLPEKITLAPLQTGMWWRSLLKKVKVYK